MILTVLAVASLLMVIVDPWERVAEHRGRGIFGDNNVDALEGVRMVANDVEYEASKGLEGKWLCSKPLGGVADSIAVRRMLASLRLLRSIRSVPRSTEHGLDIPTVRLALSFPSEKRTLEMGDKTADGRNQWVTVDGDARANLVEAHLLAELVLSIESLRNLQVIPWQLDRAEPLRIESADRWLEWEGDAVRWIDASGAKHEIRADRERALAWGEALFDLAESPEESCVAPPMLRIRQGEKVALLSEKVCVRADEPLAIVLAGWQDPRSLARMHLFTSRRPTGDFTVRCGESERRVRIAEVDQAELWRWWGRLDNAPRSLRGTSPYENLCTLSGDAWSVEIGIQGDEVLATSPHPGQLFLLDASAKASLQDLAGLFMSTLLMREDAVFLQQLEISDASIGRSWNRGGDVGTWHEKGRPLEDGDEEQLLTAIARTLATLRAERFAQEGGLMSSGGAHRKLRAFFESAIGEGGNRYEISVWGGPGACTTSVGDGPEAVLSPQDCAVLWSVQTR